MKSGSRDGPAAAMIGNQGCRRSDLEQRFRADLQFTLYGE